MYINVVQDAHISAVQDVSVYALEDANICAYINAHIGQLVSKMYSFVNYLSEDGLYGPKYIEGTSQNDKYLWLSVELSLPNTA